MRLPIQWDKRKARRNLSKHEVSFEEAATVFGDTLSVTKDPLHSSDEERRWVIVGASSRRRLLVVVHVERGDVVRIISVRLAARRERENCEKGSASST